MDGMNMSSVIPPLCRLQRKIHIRLLSSSYLHVTKLLQATPGGNKTFLFMVFWPMTFSSLWWWLANFWKSVQEGRSTTTIEISQSRKGVQNWMKVELFPTKGQNLHLHYFFQIFHKTQTTNINTIAPSIFCGLQSKGKCHMSVATIAWLIKEKTKFLQEMTQFVLECLISHIFPPRLLQEGGSDQNTKSQ